MRHTFIPLLYLNFRMCGLNSQTPQDREPGVRVLQQEKDLRLKERCVKCFLDFVILRLLAKKPMTGYEVNNLLVKNYGIMVAPNTISSKLSAMKRRGWTSVVRNRHGKTYSLTGKGQETVNNLPAIAAETHAFIRLIFGS